ncbi:MAG: hypothetical protein M1536_02665 [Firmicutes bacterium]|nr:hypothetical protein [Bacillota bacterium]
MAQDRGDRIEQVQVRRGRDNVTVGVSPYDASIAPLGAQEGADQAIAGVDFKSPWLRDRVSLSLEAQIMMVEQRASMKLGLADLGYTNKMNILPLRSGVFVKIEPTGCYRMVYNNR